MRGVALRDVGGAGGGSGRRGGRGPAFGYGGGRCPARRCHGRSRAPGDNGGGPAFAHFDLNGLGAAVRKTLLYGAGVNRSPQFQTACRPQGKGRLSLVLSALVVFTVAHSPACFIIT